MTRFMRSRLILVLAVACAVAALALTLTGARGAGQRPPCPVVVYDHSLNAPIGEVLRATRRLVPRFYARLESQGHPAWPHFQIAGLVGPNWRLTNGGIPFYARFAKSLCGERVAGLSWAAYLTFPNCQLPCAYDLALLVYTKKGWTLWDSKAYGRSLR